MLTILWKFVYEGTINTQGSHWMPAHPCSSFDFSFLCVRTVSRYWSQCDLFLSFLPHIQLLPIPLACLLSILLYPQRKHDTKHHLWYRQAKNGRGEKKRNAEKKISRAGRRGGEKIILFVSLKPLHLILQFTSLLLLLWSMHSRIMP